MVSILLVYSIEWRGVCCRPGRSSPVPWPVPRLVRCVAVSTAVMSCYCLVAMCCGVWVSISLWSLCGGAFFVSPPPLVVVGGAIVGGGWHGDVGWHGE